MRPIGYSTGSLALGDFRLGLSMMKRMKCDAVELSALREEELEPLIEAIPDLDLSKFKYCSIHAPSKLVMKKERDVLRLLDRIADRKLRIVVHPDIISDYGVWAELGNLLCIENMDKRKPIGRTARELEEIFDKLPDASLCFDIGHARQVDPTMFQASVILKQFARRIKQLHFSEVNSESKHEPLSWESIRAFQRVARWIKPNVPVILETPVQASEMKIELANAIEALTPVAKTAA